MKVIEMINWNEGKYFFDCMEQDNWKEFEECVIKYILDKNIKMNGSWHQGWHYGVPLIEHDGKYYAFMTTMRKWGGITMAAFHPEDKSEYAYMRWYCCKPDDEDQTVSEYINPHNGKEGNLKYHKFEKKNKKEFSEFIDSMMYAAGIYGLLDDYYDYDEKEKEKNDILNLEEGLLAVRDNNMKKNYLLFCKKEGKFNIWYFDEIFPYEEMEDFFDDDNNYKNR